jgi:D-sedoheptulose 7-phosphate isomerase
LTAVGNDDVYDHVFVRQIEALAQPGDVLAAISTSGNSKNIIAAVQAAKRRQCATIGITGASGGTLKGMTDVIFCAPSHQTPRIQECHLVMWHSVCEIVEQALCS